MISLSLSWVIGYGENCRGGSKDNATLDEIMELVEDILKYSGSVSLTVMDGPEIGPQRFQIITEKGNSLITLGEEDGHEYDVRSYTNNSSTGQFISICGDFWDAMTVCQNADEVRAIVKEFFVTGNVSNNILN